MASEVFTSCDRHGGEETLLCRLDPRGRILVASAFAVTVVVVQGFVPLILAFVVATICLIAGRQSPLATLKRVVAMDSFIVFMLVMLPFTVPGEPILTVWGFAASYEGLAQAGRIALQANAIVLAAMALVGSMEPVTLGHALARLRVPENLVQLMLFTVRYIEVIHQEYLRLRLAMRARGFRPGNNHHTYRSFGYLIGMMLVRALERSERILQAMKCRGFTGRLVALDNLAYARRDGFFAVISVGIILILLALEYAHVLTF